MFYPGKLLIMCRFYFILSEMTESFVKFFTIMPKQTARTSSSGCIVNINKIHFNRMVI